MYIPGLPSTHFGSAEPHEGMWAFVEKRPPDFMGLREKAAAGGSPEYPKGAFTGTCASCGATHLPSDFSHCGMCGAKLE